MPKKKPAAKKPAKKKIAPRRARRRKIPVAALVPLSLVAAATRRPKPKAAAQSPVAAHAADWLPAAMPLRELMQTRLWPEQIKVGKRHRKEFGDLAALARDIDERGLLQPIVVDRSNHLIAGERRLRAWPLTKFAGEQIPVHIVPLKDIVSGEWAENDPALRRDFTLEEAVAIKHAIESRMKPAAAARARRKGEGDGRAGDKAAAFTGKSRRTLEKAEAIVAAAKAEPEKYGPLKDAMNKSGRADGPHKRLKTMQAAAEIRSAPAPLPDNGPYRGAVIDFPWAAEPEDDDPARLARGYYPYPTMSIAQCADFARDHIKPRLHADCIVALWIPNFHLAKGHHLPIVAALGADAVTILTGIKDLIGRGQVARGSTEQVVALRLGAPPLAPFPRTDFAFKVDRKHHSRKPQSFFDMFAAAVPAERYASFFETVPRGDKWDCHGASMPAISSRTALAADVAAEGAAAAAPASTDAVSVPPARQGRAALLLADATARQRGENLDGLPRRETAPADAFAVLEWASAGGATPGGVECAFPRELLDKLAAEKLITGKHTKRITKAGRERLAVLREERAEQEALAALPSDIWSLVADYRETLARLDDAVTGRSTDLTISRAASIRTYAKRLDLLQAKANGGTSFGMATDDFACRAVARRDLGGDRHGAGVGPARPFRTRYRRRDLSRRRRRKYLG